MVLAVLMAVVLSNILHRWMIGVPPPGLIIIAVITTILVSTPLIAHFLHTIRFLDKVKREFCDQAQMLDQRNTELAQARDALTEINETLECRIRGRTADLEHARRIAEEANAAKSQFLANMSHELRTPLNAIIGFSDTLVQRKAIFPDCSEARTDEYAGAIRGSGQLLLSLVNDLLDLARIECGELDIVPERLDIDATIDGALLVVVPQAEKRAQTIITDTDGLPSRFFEADARAMQQILVNLLSNALKFSPEGSDVTLDVIGNADGTTFIVTDRGIGMTPEEAQAALHPFSRFSEAHIASGESIGLGLSIVNAFCTLHGGSLTFDSNKGEGTIARVHIPNSLGRAALRPAAA
jgi:signal transduction histidine kinase